jgi:hypothetical protein
MLEWIAGILIVVALLGLGVWLLRGYLSGNPMAEAIFGQKVERRIGVSETVTVDGRRKLMLVYRDGVEHLVMTGGPIDMVIEQNIQPQRRPAYEARSTAAASASGEPSENSSSTGFGRARQRPPQPSLES